MLASLPSVALTSLIAYNVIHATPALAVGDAGTLLRALAKIHVECRRPRMP
jgi:hypothetical protein